VRPGTFDTGQSKETKQQKHQNPDPCECRCRWSLPTPLSLTHATQNTPRRVVVRGRGGPRARRPRAPASLPGISPTPPHVPSLRCATHLTPPSSAHALARRLPPTVLLAAATATATRYRRYSHHSYNPREGRMAPCARRETRATDVSAASARICRLSRAAPHRTGPPPPPRHNHAGVLSSALATACGPTPSGPMKARRGIRKRTAHK